MSDEKWKCPKCGAENDSENAFCGECGTKKPERNMIIGQAVAKQEKKNEASGEEKTQADAAAEKIKKEKKKRGCFGCFGKLIIILLAIAVLGFAGFVGVVAIANGISVKVVLFQLYGEFFPAPKAVYIKGHVHGQDWSYPSDYKMDWNEAVKYCDNLTEDGHSDWRLPTISELRHLIKECPKTMSGGTCRVSDKCLESSCYSNNDCYCSGGRSGIYSEFGERGYFWSSSTTRSDDTDLPCIVDFSEGGVYCGYGKSNNFYVRCVR